MLYCNTTIFLTLCDTIKDQICYIFNKTLCFKKSSVSKEPRNFCLCGIMFGIRDFSFLLETDHCVKMNRLGEYRVWEIFRLKELDYMETVSKSLNRFQITEWESLSILVCFLICYAWTLLLKYLSLMLFITARKPTWFDVKTL